MLSSAFWTASGLFGKGGFSPGRLIGGALSFASDANIVFTGEHIGEIQANPHKEGTASYYATELKNRPVLLSSMFNIASDVASIAGGAHERFKGKESNTLYAGIFLLMANVFQAIFVNKNDYNIEKSAPSKTEKLQTISDLEKPISSKVANLQPKPIQKTAPEIKKTWEERAQKPSDEQLQYVSGASI